MEKTCFQRGFVFLRNFIYKEKCGKGASKTEVSQENLTSIWELHDIWEVHFGTLVLAKHYYSGDKKWNTDFF